VDAYVIRSNSAAAIKGKNRLRALGGFSMIIPSPIPKKLAISAKFLR
jgi:hypothetical protein